MCGISQQVHDKATVVLHTDQYDDIQVSALVIDDAQVAGDQLVFEVGSVGDHDLGALVGDQDTGTGESDTLADPDVTRDGQVVEHEDVGDRLESLLKVLPGLARVAFAAKPRLRGEARLTATFLKLSPSLTTGVPPNSRDLSIVKTPCSRL